MIGRVTCLAALAVALSVGPGPIGLGPIGLGPIGLGAMAAQAATSPLEKAGWTLVTSSDDTMVYMKPAPSGGSGKLRRVWTAYDSTRPLQRGGLTFRSVKALGEFDCARQVSRVLEETFHEAPALQSEGRKIPGWIPTDWQPVEPGSVGAIRMAYACNETGET